MSVTGQADKSAVVAPSVRVMGILNVTPDSFSDGGAYLDPDRAVARAEQMIREGADIIDIGPESTRPGSLPVDTEEQIRRAIPVIKELCRRDPSVRISIDTTQSRVALEAIRAGADIVNDTSALRDDPHMAGVVVESGAFVILMHRRGTPDAMQGGGGPHYEDVVEQIKAFLDERVRSAIERSIDPDRIVVDPGLGFGKRTAHNLRILQYAGRFGDLSCGRFPVLIGASRKRFVGETLGIEDPRARDAASSVAALLAVQNGASIIRTHDVKGTVQALALLAAVRGEHMSKREKESAQHHR